jgi:hypothetical protein
MNADPAKTSAARRLGFAATQLDVGEIAAQACKRIVYVPLSLG